MIKAGETGKCPHCGVINRFEGFVQNITVNGARRKIRKFK